MPRRKRPSPLRSTFEPPISKRGRTKHWLSDKILEVTQRLEDRRLRNSGPDRPSLSNPQLMEDLSVALEELHVTAAELEHQTEELESARQALDSARRSYLELFELAPDADLVTDPAGVIAGANRAAAVLLGVSGRALVGKPLAVFLGESDRRTFYTKLRKLSEPGARGPRDWELAVLPRRGGAVPVGATVGLMRDTQDRLTGLRFLLRDISDRERTEEALREAHRSLEARVKERTSQLQAANAGLEREIEERRRVEEALRESEARYRVLVEHSPEAIVVLDADRGRLVDANENAVRLFGLERSALLEVGFVEMSPPTQPDGRPSAESVAEKLEEALKGGLPVFEWLHRNGAGQFIPCEVRLVRLPAVGRKLVRASVTDISDRKRAEEQIRGLAYHDSLTGLPNRLLFSDRLAVAVSHAFRHHQNLAVLFLDLDRFKLVNDSLGHRIGDRLLRAVAERIKSCVREGDTVARLGGDEFTLLLPGLSDLSDGVRAAEKILASLRPPFHVDGRELFVTASMGVSFYPEGGQNVESLVKSADSAMYRAKEEGRDCFRLYIPGTIAQATERLTLENSLRRALEQDELLLHYQPVLDVETRSVQGVEALVRWRHPRRGPLPPGDFVPVAEVTGLIVPIGIWILRAACAQAAEWRERGHRHLRMAVNISARQFQQPDLVSEVERVLDETGLDPRALDLEITESCALAKVERAIRVLQEIKRLGVGISLDDFGTGYSSLSYLRRLPIDVVKIDQSFVRDLTVDPEGAAIIHAVIAMAHSLNLRVVAEGVETEEQLAFLTTHNCDLMQGFLFSEPLPAKACEELLHAGGLPPTDAGQIQRRSPRNEVNLL
jgi:diguanylate cyclase (GGDEF)-like protein/PAS domain S-box-containing protein